MNFKKVTPKSAVRFGVSIESELLTQFDRWIKDMGYANRSEAIRKLIRERLVQKEWEFSREEVAATITMVYGHEGREITRRLAHIQHEYYRNIISTMHIHLDEHNCLEVIVVKGRADAVKDIADRLLSTKGIKHGKLVATTTGRRLV